MLKKIFACGAALLISTAVIASPSDITSPVVAIGEQTDKTETSPAGSDAFCSGTFVAPSIVLTAGHCVRDGTVEVVITADHKIHGVKEVLVDDDLNDYALIETYDKVETWMSLDCKSWLHLGDDLTVSGYPMDFGKLTVPAKIIGFDPEDPAAQRLWPNGSFVVFGMFAPGMSGSAVTNDKGKVVGVFVGGYGTSFGAIGIAVPVDAACIALGSYGT